MLHSLRFTAALALALTFGLAYGDELDPSVPFTPETSAPSVGDLASSGAEMVLQPLERTILATHPTVHYRFLQAGGVLSQPGQEQNTTVQNFSVGLSWHLGEYLQFRYSPEWTMYSNRAFQNEFGQDAGIWYRRSFTDWNVSLSHRYSRLSIPLIETGRQTTQSSNSSRVEVGRQLGALTTLELGLTQSIRNVSGFSDYRDWSTDDWLSYAISDAIQVAVGVGYGYANVPDGSDMSYTRLNTRLRWHATEKIDLDVRAGADSRHFVSSQAPDARTPVYGASLHYSPLPTTTISLTGERVITPSYFAGEVNRTNTWLLEVNQRLLQRFFASVSYVRRIASSHSAIADVPTSREDDGRSIGLRLGTKFRSNGAVSVFYQERKNHSNTTGFNVDGRHYGFEIGLEF